MRNGMRSCGAGRDPTGPAVASCTRACSTSAAPASFVSVARKREGETLSTASAKSPPAARARAASTELAASTAKNGGSAGAAVRTTINGPRLDASSMASPGATTRVGTSPLAARASAFASIASLSARRPTREGYEKSGLLHAAELFAADLAVRDLLVAWADVHVPTRLERMHDRAARYRAIGRQ